MLGEWGPGACRRSWRERVAHAPCLRSPAPSPEGLCRMGLGGEGPPQDKPFSHPATCSGLCHSGVTGSGRQCWLTEHQAESGAPLPQVSRSLSPRRPSAPGVWRATPELQGLGPLASDTGLWCSATRTGGQGLQGAIEGCVRVRPHCPRRKSASPWSQGWLSP